MTLERHCYSGQGARSVHTVTALKSKFLGKEKWQAK
uniref:Uncharacterized protein n=1 Tax=Rhizophora mucronata TaxID=61149 RepID=A0A2P2NLQ6_RHIMU